MAYSRGPEIRTIGWLQVMSAFDQEILLKELTGFYDAIRNDNRSFIITGTRILKN
jgi:hypothetical protein